MLKSDGRKDDKPKGLGFFYPHECAVYVDAEEYRALLNSGKLSEDEASFLRQFLKEYYGRPVKSEVLIHDSCTLLIATQHSRRRDVTMITEPATSYSAYTSADYFAPRANPEEMLLFREELHDYKARKRKKEILE